MAISLNKGGNLSLSKTDPNLTHVLVGLGWDARSTDGVDFDLDASAFLLNESGKVRAETDFIFYNQTRSPEGSVEHTGDNRTGAGDGDDEVIHVDLTKVPPQVKSIVFTISSFRGQTFESVENAFCRVVDATSNTEIAKYNLSAKGNYTALIVAKVYRHNCAWKMSALGETSNGKTIQDMIPSILPVL